MGSGSLERSLRGWYLSTGRVQRNSFKKSIVSPGQNELSVFLCEVLKASHWGMRLANNRMGVMQEEDSLSDKRPCTMGAQMGPWNVVCQSLKILQKDQKQDCPARVTD